MRTFRIDYTNIENKLPDGDIVGKYGEHNATILSITPPAEMTESEEIICYRIAFGLINYRTVTSEPLDKTEAVSFPLNAQITRSDTVSVQLIGYDAENNLVMKSETVKKLKFAESVGGTEIPADGNSHNLGAEVAEMKTKLNKFGEDANGKLTYNNNPISGERPTLSVELNSDEYYIGSGSNNNFCLVDSSAMFANGDEIKSIEMFYRNEWIDLKDIARFDGAPMIINMFKVTDECGSNIGETVLAFMYCPESTGVLFDLLLDNKIEKLRVTIYVR